MSASNSESSDASSVCSACMAVGEVDTDAGSESMDAWELGCTGVFADEGVYTLPGVLEVSLNVGRSNVLMRKAVFRRSVMSESVKH